MKAVCRWLCVAALCWPAAGKVLAGDMYPITLRGTVYQDDTGQIQGVPLTDQTMLQNIADKSGLAVSSLTIVYHVNGTIFGDTIDVINRDTGQVLDNLYGFYFGENFGARRALYSLSGKDQRRLDYIYTHQSDMAVGSAVIAKREVRLRGGGTRLLVSGSLQWIVTPENGQPSQLCTAKFKSGPQLTF